jgi:hypothetical protein
MGCCFASGRDDGVDLISDATNSAVKCKAGPMGSSITVIQDEATGNYHAQHSGKHEAGLILGSCPLDCDTAMWEVKLGSNPAGLTIGVKRYTAKKNKDENILNCALDNTSESEKKVQTSWYLDWKDLKVEPKEGDCIGVYWDQTDLPMVSFSLNGEMLHSASINRIRPSQDIHPAVSLKAGSTCDLIFDGDNFICPPKSKKFGSIVCATSLI